MSYSELDLSILKTLVNNKKRALDFIGECDAKLFSPDVWNFANLVINYVKVYKDVPTLKIINERLSKGGNESAIENVKKIWEQIDKLSFDEKEYAHSLEKLKKRFAEKQIATIKESFSKFESGSMDISKAVGEMQKTIQNIKGLNQSRSFERKTVKEFLPDFVEKFNIKRNNPNFDVGIKTGYSFFDFATNGVKAADFIIIAGESGFGKSLFLQNIAVQTWLQGNTLDTPPEEWVAGKNIVYFSLEMPYEDCFVRFLSRLSGVASRKIENASLTKEEFLKVKKVLTFIDKYPYQFEIVDISDACANDLELILSDIQYQIDVIFVDYLGIMKSNEGSEEQDWLKQGIIAYETRAIARKRNLPIFTAVQLNRKSKTKDKEDSNIGLSRLARSATIATHATTVIQIENRPNEEQHSSFIYHIIKNRKGLKGAGELIKNLSCATLLDNNKLKEDENHNQEYDSSDINDISEEVEKLGF